uniref:Uncharacterized protein n=1 Tax=Arundo donax TaxID=35708 RepID=A0A0A9B4T7_ARUDO
MQCNVMEARRGRTVATSRAWCTASVAHADRHHQVMATDRGILLDFIAIFTKYRCMHELYRRVWTILLIFCVGSDLVCSFSFVFLV